MYFLLDRAGITPFWHREDAKFKIHAKYSTSKVPDLRMYDLLVPAGLSLFSSREDAKFKRPAENRTSKILADVLFNLFQYLF